VSSVHAVRGHKVKSQGHPAGRLNAGTELFLPCAEDNQRLAGQDSAAGVQLHAAGRPLSVGTRLQEMEVDRVRGSPVVAGVAKTRLRRSTREQRGCSHRSDRGALWYGASVHRAASRTGYAHRSARTRQQMSQRQVCMHIHRCKKTLNRQ